VRARLPYYRAPSHPQPMIYDQTAYSSPSVDQIRTVWSPSGGQDQSPVFFVWQSMAPKFGPDCLFYYFYPSVFIQTPFWLYVFYFAYLICFF
jgi:hypothetical protein